MAICTPPSLQIIYLFTGFAQSHMTSAAQTTFTLAEQLLWTFVFFFLIP